MKLNFSVPNLIAQSAVTDLEIYCFNQDEYNTGGKLNKKTGFFGDVTVVNMLEFKVNW